MTSLANSDNRRLRMREKKAGRRTDLDRSDVGFGPEGPSPRIENFDRFTSKLYGTELLVRPGISCPRSNESEFRAKPRYAVSVPCGLSQYALIWAFSLLSQCTSVRALCCVSIQRINRVEPHKPLITYSQHLAEATEELGPLAVGQLGQVLQPPADCGQGFRVGQT